MKISDLFDFCTTDRQREYIQAIIDAPSKAQAARDLNISERVLTRALQQIRERANQQYTPPHDSSIETKIPEGYRIKGVSNMVENSLGKPMWVKTERTEEEKYRVLMDTVQSLANEAPVRDRIDIARHVTGDDLANLYTFSDYHLGMLAWHKEGGDNWNLDIATEVLTAAYSDMITRSPEADTCIVNELGDWEHYTSMLALTPAHGNILDSDTRPEKMIDISWQCMDHLISEGLKNHNNVKVVIAQGNHNDFVSLARKVSFKRMYANNPRVEFVDSQNPFYGMTWGRNFLGFHHGHKVKPREMPMVFAAEYRHMLGQTDRTYLHCGHQHHKEIIEITGAVVEMHRTLAPRDAHASYGGYHAIRATDAITYHKEFGEFSRLTVYPHLYGDC